MKSEHNTYDYLLGYFNKTRAKGRYAVTLDELRKSFSVSNKALIQGLYRLKTKKEISQVRQGFYVLIPPEHSQRGMLPAYLFIDDLMRHLKRQYYVGLFTAAALHGAGHQQPMEYQVINSFPPLREVKNDKIAIRFFPKKAWNETDVMDKKTDAGYIKVSSPELTVLDLVGFHYKIGGIIRIVSILEELIEETKTSQLMKAVKNYNNTSCLQRLGYLAEHVFGKENFAAGIYDYLKTQKTYPIPLSAGTNGKQAFETDKKWKIIINLEIEAQ